MKVTEKYCNVSIIMQSGRPIDCRMYTTITVNGTEKGYHKKLTHAQAARAIYKLEKATGCKPTIHYNSCDHTLTTKTISYFWEA